MRWIVLGFVLVVVAAGGWFGWTEWQLTKIDRIPYRVEQADGTFEIRRYPRLVTASIDVSGPRGDALSEGFGPLAGFIGGENQADDRIDMTRPILQRPADSQVASNLPMGEEAWTISFVMPSWFSAGTLPRPTDQAITIGASQPLRVAAVRFSGFMSDDAIAAQTQALRRWMDAQKLVAGGPPRFAIYDPPWRLPFLRRNEVLIPLAPADS